jgi:Dolichyl-phosphate-mannose-protein mannosyltransferase
MYVLCLNGTYSTDHTTSFLELAWAIWHNHSFALAKVNNSISCPSGGANPIEYTTGVYCTVDDFVYKGSYYSALAPGTVFLMLPFAALGFIKNGAFSLYGTVLLYSEFFIALTNSLATIFLYKICRLYFQETTAIFIALAYAFSTIAWPFATFLFQSDPSAAFDLLAAFLLLRMVRANKINLRGSIFCGLALATAVTIDYVNAILIPIFLFYLLFSVRKESLQVVVKDLLGFFLAAFVSAGVIGAYDYLSFGNLFLTSESLYLGGGLFSSFSEPLDWGLLLNLFTPYRGLFIYSPILILGVYGFYKMLRSNVYDKDGVFILALFLGILFPYSKWYVLDAGLSYGPRFVIPAIPFLLIPVGFVINEPKQRGNRILAYCLFAIGVVTNGIAALTSALAGTETSWLRSPFLDSAYPLFIQHNFDSWFLAPFAQEYWWLIGALFIGVALIMPVIFYRLLGAKDFVDRGVN